MKQLTRAELKKLVLNHGTVNNWKGYVGLYLTTSQLRNLKRYVPAFDTKSLKSIYEAL
jgi:hypothetical protein